MLKISGVSKSFEGQKVLDDVSLSVEEGEVLALLGPSGSGKTTLLRIIAGLEAADEGRVLLGGKDLSSLAVHERGFGMVFQDYALFPHKNVAQNVAFGLRMQNWSRQRTQDRVTELLALVGLKGFEERAVYELSGGEQQRVALARALAPAPRLLLLDEPLGALDHALRERLLAELRTILEEADKINMASGGTSPGITAVYVTHDQAEAFAVADRVALLRVGRLEQVDTAVNLYRRPKSAFVARFLGMDNLFDGHFVAQAPPTFSCALGTLALAPENVPEGAQGANGTLLVRPDAGRLLRPGEANTNVVRGEIEAVTFRGRYQEALVRLPDDVTLSLEFDAGVTLPGRDEMVAISLEPRELILVEAGNKGSEAC